MTDLNVSIKSDEEPPKPKHFVGVRHLQFFLMFSLLSVSYGMRATLSVAIIEMTSESPTNPEVPSYPEWTNSGIILSSFFWGYFLLQPCAGQLGEYFGPKWFLVGTLAVGSAFHAAIPAMAESMGSAGVITCRVIQGLLQGFIYPSLQNLMSKWTPIFERSRVSNFVYGADAIGTAVALPVTGAIAASRGGWPVAFYLYGGLGLICALLFAIFGGNSPDAHPWVSENEKMYIHYGSGVTISKKKLPTPWKSIFTSVPLYAILVAGCAEAYGSFVLLAEIPSYLSHYMKYDIEDNSQLAALPYVAYFFIGLLTSPLSDYLISHGILTLTTARKLFQSLSGFGPAAALVGLAFVEEGQRDLAIALLILSVGTNAFFHSGYIVNLIDIAPNHAGTTFGFVNSVNNIFSIIGPLTVGLFGDDKTDPILWRKVFLLTAGVFAGCCIFYNIFTTAEVQSWNEPQECSNDGTQKCGKADPGGVIPSKV